MILHLFLFYSDLNNSLANSILLHLITLTIREFSRQCSSEVELHYVHSLTNRQNFSFGRTTTREPLAEKHSCDLQGKQILTHN